MTPLYDDMDTLIAQYLANEITPEAAAVLEQWLAAAPQNKAYFEQLQQLWHLSPKAKIPPTAEFDTEKALAKVKTAIQRQKRPVFGGLSLRYAAAAAVALLCFAVWYLYPSTVPAVQLAASPTEVQTYTLTDGSAVTLNRSSGVIVQQGFNQKERRLALRGEAYFEVQPDAARPFVVEVAEVEVKVLGTAFNVDNGTDPDKVHISVRHGKVAVTAHGQTIYLTADQQAVYHRATQVLEPLLPAQAAQNPIAYKDRVFHFKATPLKTVAASVYKVYGVQLVFANPALEKCMLTATFNNLPLERVVELIAASFDIRLTKLPNGNYELSGDGCE